MYIAQISYTSEVKQYLLYCNSPSDLMIPLNFALLFLLIVSFEALRLNNSPTLG